MKKVLLVTSKWFRPTDSSDGGDSTVSEMIGALGEVCRLDVLCFRRYDKDMATPLINEVFFQSLDFANYDLYSKRAGEKFFIRLKQADISAGKIAEMASGYDVIILQHCMFALKLTDYDASIFDKLVQLPMFTGTAYIKAGEFVPTEYLEAEKEALRRIPKFITPSSIERRTLIEDYGIDAEKIFVIPRSIRGIKFVERKVCSKTPGLIYIASIRRQKAHSDAMRLIKILREHIKNIRLHCVGTVQDEAIFKNCSAYLKANELEDAVIFHGTLSRNEVNALFEQCDINISVSQWETFGRGIFEGMAAGLPTVISDRIQTASDFPRSMRPLSARNLSDMARCIVDLCGNDSLFALESAKGKCIQEYLSFPKIRMLLRKCILSNGRGE